MTDPACARRLVARCMLLACGGALAFFGITPAAGAAVADFTWSPDPPVRNEQAIFTAVQDPSIVAYAWDLDGNGRYDDSADAMGPQVPRTFQNARTYEIGLAVVDDVGNISEHRKSVTVVSGDSGGPSANQAPQASFVFFPAGPVAGEPVTLVSTATDVDSPIPGSALRWDLNGDGVYDDAEGQTATTTFPSPGAYPVSLEVTTNATALATAVLNVGTPGLPGSGVGQRGLGLMSPFPVVRIAGRVSRRGARIRRLTVDAPPGTAVSVTCDGRGCPFGQVAKSVSSRLRAGQLPASRVLRIRRLEGKLLRAGATLKLFVTRPNTVGKYTRFTIRRGKSPARSDRCLVPGNGRALPCPSR